MSYKNKEKPGNKDQTIKRQKSKIKQVNNNKAVTGQLKICIPNNASSQVYLRWHCERYWD